MAFSQNAPTEVSIVVSADGATKTEAIDNALRSAVEQTYGTFVSANTTILNDELVKDEIATISSGNIQKYSEIACVTLPSGNTSVTLDVVFSITKLVSYAQSKGSECEFAGATFGANKRLYDFNKANEIRAIENMIKQLDALRPVYDYEIKVSDPVLQKDNQNAKIKIQVIVKSNDKTKQFYNIIKSTIMSLAMTPEQIAPMKTNGFRFEEYLLVFDDNRKNNKSIKMPKTKYYFYTTKIHDLDFFLENTLFDYALTDNNGDEFINFILDESWTEFTGFRFDTKSGQYVWPFSYDPKWYHSENNVIWVDNGAKGPVQCKLGKIKIFSINCLPIVWVFPEASYYVPVDELGQINNISIMPTKKDATNFVINSDCGDLNRYMPYVKLISNTYHYFHMVSYIYSYFNFNKGTSNSIHQTIAIYKEVRNKNVGAIDMKDINKELNKLKNK